MLASSRRSSVCTAQKTHMKAFLLAAGPGTRLRPLTDRVPKCLLPVGGVPLLSLWVKALSSIGVDQVLVNTHHLPEQVRVWAETQPLQVTLTYEPELLGSAGTLRTNRAFVRDDDSFLIVYADMWVKTDLRMLLDKHGKHSAPLTIGVYPARFPRESGIVVLDKEDLVVDFEEKPLNPKSSWANAGLMVARGDFFSFLPDRVFCDLSLDVLPTLVKQMVACRMTGVFHDIGTLLRYAEAQLLALGEAHVYG